MTHTVQHVAQWAGVSMDFLLGLLRLGVIEPPDAGRAYSDASARRVVTVLKTRWQRLIEDTWERHLKRQATV